MASGKKLKAIVGISGSVDPKLNKSIASASGAMQKFGKTAKTISKVSAVAFAAVATAAVAAGKQLVDLGTEFEKAENKIRVGTGATGKDLKSLYSTMQSVYKSVPTTLDDASKSIADWNTRLGVSGKVLKNLSKQSIQVNKMLGDNLNGVIEESSQAMQQWGVKSDNMTKKMDYIFKVSQSTGMGFTALMKSMQSSGNVLKSLGFNFEEAATLIGSLDKAGIESGQVLKGMKKGLINVSKSGGDVVSTMNKYVKEIANAKTKSDALTKATEIFGAASAGTMVQAIQKGALNVGEMTKALKKNKESINGAAKDTYTFADRWKMVKQNLETAIEPLAKSLVNALNKSMPYIKQVLKDLQPKIQQFAKNLGPAIQDFAQKKLPELANSLSTLAEKVRSVIGWVTNNWGTISKVAPVVAGITVVIGPLTSALSGLGGAVKGIVGGVKGLAGKLSGVGSAAASAAPSVSAAGSSFSTLGGQALLLVAAGVAVGLIAGAMWILAQAAIQLAAAGPGAVAVFVLMAGVAIGVTAAIVAIGAASTVSAIGLLAMGAAVLMVGAGIAIAAAGAALFCTQLPTIATYGPAAAAGILMLSGAMLVFSAALLLMTASLLAGTVSMVAFGATALIGAAGAIAFGVSMGIAAASSLLLLVALVGIQASVSSIKEDATAAADALTGMSDSVSAVQAVLDGLGDLASGAVDAVLSIFSDSGEEAKADGAVLGNSLAEGLTNGITSAATTFAASFLAIKLVALKQLKDLQKMFSETKFELNHDIDLPHFALKGDFDAKKNKVPDVDVKWYAAGGFTDGLSIAGEDGMEAVLSFDPAYRSQNLSYWARAGQLLGVDTNMIDLMTGTASAGGTTEISLGGVSFSPNININGNADKEDVIAAIKAEEPEFFDLLDRYLTVKERELYGISV